MDPQRHQHQLFNFDLSVIYKTLSCVLSGDSCGNRTRVAGVRGRSLNRLTNEPFFKGLIVVSPLLLVHHQGLEPGTPWLRVRCSTNWANGAFFSRFITSSWGSCGFPTMPTSIFYVSGNVRSSSLTDLESELFTFCCNKIDRLKRIEINLSNLSLFCSDILLFKIPWKLNKEWDKIGKYRKNTYNETDQRVWSSPRPISTAKLNMSPCLHTQPINLVVFKGSYSLTRWDI